MPVVSKDLFVLLGHLLPRLKTAQNLTRGLLAQVQCRGHLTVGAARRRASDLWEVRSVPTGGGAGAEAQGQDSGPAQGSEEVPTEGKPGLVPVSEQHETVSTSVGTSRHWESEAGEGARACGVEMWDCLLAGELIKYSKYIKGNRREDSHVWRMQLQIWKGREN